MFETSFIRLLIEIVKSKESCYILCAGPVIFARASRFPKICTKFFLLFVCAIYFTLYSLVILQLGRGGQWQYSQGNLELCVILGGVEFCLNLGT